MSIAEHSLQAQGQCHSSPTEGPPLQRHMQPAPPAHSSRTPDTSPFTTNTSHSFDGSTNIIPHYMPGTSPHCRHSRETGGQGPASGVTVSLHRMTSDSRRGCGGETQGRGNMTLGGGPETGGAERAVGTSST